MIKNRQMPWRILTMVYLAAVSYLCFAPAGAFPTITEWHFFIPADKVVHFCMFTPFPVLMFFAFAKKSSARIGLYLLTGAAMALLTECIQGLTKTRSMDMTDFAADSCGLIFSCLLLLAFWKVCGRQETR